MAVTIKQKRKKKRIRKFLMESIAVVLALVVFGIPFSFVLLNSAKPRAEALQFRLSLPEEFAAVENFTEVFTTQNFMVVRGFVNSLIITVVSVVLLIFMCALAGFVMQRRRNKVTALASYLSLTGLMVPPAIVPTIWVLQFLGVFGNLSAMILVQIALQAPFSILLYRGFSSGIPREIDEAAFIDGCGPIRFFFNIVFPLLKPVTATIAIITAITIYNDFANALYFLPGARNVTVQITMFNFFGQFGSAWNLLFANVVLISVPPLIMFLFFSKRIVSGMVAGAIKG